MVEIPHDLATLKRTEIKMMKQKVRAQSLDMMSRRGKILKSGRYHEILVT